MFQHQKSMNIQENCLFRVFLEKNHLCMESACLKKQNKR
nr:MAG TPA: hypothetical protein [Caudoviricetes sp.]